MKILFPFVGDSVGGSHNSILELYYCLKKTSVVPIIVIHNKGPLADYLDELKIPYEFLIVNKLAGESPNILKVIFGIFSNFFIIKKFLKVHNFDIVHGNDLRINLSWSLPTRILKLHYIWHQRTTMSNSLLWMLSSFLSNHIVAISSHVYQSLPSNIPLTKKSLVLNPFNVEKIYDKKDSRKWVNALYKIPEDTILFGYVGRLITWKNVDVLIRYFNHFIKNKNKNKSIHLLIVGTGSKEYVDKLKNIALKLGIDNKVIFVGFSSESLRIIASLDLLISSSNNEPFGRTIVEAMIQNTSVLAAYGAGHNETINPGITGYLYKHESLEDFSKQCDSNLNNKVEKEKIIKNANESVFLKYSSFQHAEAILKIYKSVIIK